MLEPGSLISDCTGTSVGVYMTNTGAAIASVSQHDRSWYRIWYLVDLALNQHGPKYGEMSSIHGIVGGLRVSKWPWTITDWFIWSCWLLFTQKAAKRTMAGVCVQGIGTLWNVRGNLSWREHTLFQCAYSKGLVVNECLEMYQLIFSQLSAYQRHNFGKVR